MVTPARKPPGEQAHARLYRRRWLRLATRRTWAFERRYGIWLTVVLGGLAGAVEAMFGARVSAWSILLAAAAAAVVVLVLGFLGSLVAVPIEMDYRGGVVGVGGDMDQVMTLARDNPRAFLVTFPTRNAPNRMLNVVVRPSAVRLVSPPSDRILRESDLPAVLPVSRRGRLVIQAFGDGEIRLSEERTSGRMIELEVYASEHPLDKEVTLRDESE